MKTVIVGGGKGCRAILDVATGEFLREMTIEVERVVDLDPQARGMLHAAELGIPTGNDFVSAMSTRLWLSSSDTALVDRRRRVLAWRHARDSWNVQLLRQEGTGDFAPQRREASQSYRPVPWTGGTCVATHHGSS